MKGAEIAVVAVALTFGIGFVMWKRGMFSMIDGAPGSAGNPTDSARAWDAQSLVAGNIGPFADPNIYALALAKYSNNDDPTQSGS